MGTLTLRSVTRTYLPCIVWLIMTVIMDQKLQTSPPSLTAWHTSRGYCTWRPVPTECLMAEKLARSHWKSCSPFPCYPRSTTRCILHHAALQCWEHQSVYLIAVLVDSGERGRCLCYYIHQDCWSSTFSSVGGRQAPSISHIQIIQLASKPGARLPLPYVFLPYQSGGRQLLKLSMYPTAELSRLSFSIHLLPSSTPCCASVQFGCKGDFQGSYINIWLRAVQQMCCSSAKSASTPVYALSLLLKLEEKKT